MSIIRMGIWKWSQRNQNYEIVINNSIRYYTIISNPAIHLNCYKSYDFHSVSGYQLSVLYDFTRVVLRHNPAIIKYKDFSSANLKDITNVWYRISRVISMSVSSTCLNMFLRNLPEFFQFVNKILLSMNMSTKPTYQYCLSKENHAQCARYKMPTRKEPTGLTPDGQNVIERFFIKQRLFLINESGELGKEG